MTRKAKNNKQENLVSKLTPEKFIQEFVKKQNELLQATAQCIEKGEIELIGVEYADEIIETIVDEWCEQQEPDITTHLKMNAAVFLWALLDQLDENDIIDNDNDNNGNFRDAANMNGDTHPGFVVAVEILKTVRSIWGKENKNG